MRDTSSLIFETPIQHNYEAGVEVRSLLPTEQLEEVDGRLAVFDVAPSSGTRFVRFLVDEIPLSTEAGSHGDDGHPHVPAMSRDVSRTPVTPKRRERGSPRQEVAERDRSRGSPDFGGGIGYREHDGQQREHIPEGGGSSQYREHIPNNDRVTPPRLLNQSRTPPEDQNPRGCSLHSMEPLREWFCKGSDMTSAEAALCQLENDPPDIRQYNANIREERWTNFSLEGVRFPAMTIDVREALAIFERDLIHFQQISRAAALYIWALLGGIKRALEIYRRVDETTKNYPWSAPTTEEQWHSHAEGVLIVALTTLNLPTEAWKSAR